MKRGSMLEGEQLGAFGSNRQPNRRGWSKRQKALGAVGGLALAGGIAMIYTHWEDIKRFFKWGQLANGAAADSVVLLETKLDHAILLCKNGADAVSLKHAIEAAGEEASKLVAINQQLREKLKATLPKV
jgi:hypothetical protein